MLSFEHTTDTLWVGFTLLPQSAPQGKTAVQASADGRQGVFVAACAAGVLRGESSAFFLLPLVTTTCAHTHVYICWLHPAGAFVHLICALLADGVLMCTVVLILASVCWPAGVLQSTGMAWQCHAAAWMALVLGLLEVGCMSGSFALVLLS